MQEIELIQDRIISGKGILKVPTDVEKNRYYVLYVDVFRKPTNPYLNLNYNPARARYATITFLRKEYVIADTAIEYERQAFDGVNDVSGQTLLAVKCMYKGVLQTFINLGLALGLPPISVTDTIEEYKNLRLAWDEIRVKCYSDTALQCRLYRLKYDVCNADLDDDFPPPPPDEPFPTLPPGTPTAAISPPYDEGNDDDNNTIPSPIDQGVEPVTCVITYDYVDLRNSSQSGIFTFNVNGVFPPLSVSAPVYSLPGNNPPGSFRKSDVTITDVTGATQTVNVVTNSIAGHTVSGFRSPCIF